jgi:hypothetical protein
MLPLLIVADKERVYPLYRLPWRLIIFPVDLRIFHSPPPSLYKDVVQRPSTPVYADFEPPLPPTAR